MSVGVDSSRKRARDDVPPKRKADPIGKLDSLLRSAEYAAIVAPSADRPAEYGAVARSSWRMLETMADREQADAKFMYRLFETAKLQALRSKAEVMASCYAAGKAAEEGRDVAYTVSYWKDAYKAVREQGAEIAGCGQYASQFDSDMRVASLRMQHMQQASAEAARMKEVMER